MATVKDLIQSSGGLDIPFGEGWDTPGQRLQTLGFDPSNLNATIPDPLKGSLMPTGNDLAGMSLGIGGVLGMLAPAVMGAAGAAGATEGAGAAGAMMPAAVPESAATLSGWGLTETAPGVWGSAGSLMPPAVAESPAALQSQGLTQTAPGVWEQMGLPGGPPGGGGFGNIPTNIPGAGGGGGGGMAPGGAPGGAGGAGAPVPPATPGTPGSSPMGASGGVQGGTSFVDKILADMKAHPLNAAGLGLSAAGMLAQGRPKQPAQVGQLGQLGTTGQQTAQQLLDQYKSGQLSGPQQASLQQLSQNARNQINNYFASIRQSDSTAHQQALAQVDQQAESMKNEMLQQALNSGLQAIGVAAGPLNNVAQYTLGQDRNLQAAFANFANALGNFGGRGAQQNANPTQQTQPTQQNTWT